MFIAMWLYFYAPVSESEEIMYIAEVKIYCKDKQPTAHLHDAPL